MWMPLMLPADPEQSIGNQALCTGSSSISTASETQLCPSNQSQPCPSTWSHSMPRKSAAASTSCSLQPRINCCMWQASWELRRAHCCAARVQSIPTLCAVPPLPDPNSAHCLSGITAACAPGCLSCLPGCSSLRLNQQPCSSRVWRHCSSVLCCFNISRRMPS